MEMFWLACGFCVVVMLAAAFPEKFPWLKR